MILDEGYLWRMPEDMVAGSDYEPGDIGSTTFGGKEANYPASELLCAHRLALYASVALGGEVLVVFNGEPFQRARSLMKPIDAPQPIDWESLIERERIEP